MMVYIGLIEYLTHTISYQSNDWLKLTPSHLLSPLPTSPPLSTDYTYHFLCPLPFVK